MSKRFEKILVANRGEIAIRVFRACYDLGLKTVAIYSKEDINSLHRTRADEAYMVGMRKSPLAGYLDIDRIIQIALDHDVDAIHPGYGFLSENADLARACEENGIAFIGPPSHILAQMGDKLAAKRIAARAGVRTIPGTPDPITDLDQAAKTARVRLSRYPKGGGRRAAGAVCAKFKTSKSCAIISRWCRAKRSRPLATGIFSLKNTSKSPSTSRCRFWAIRMETSCICMSATALWQRRYQKVVEYAPAFTVPQETRNHLYEDALKIAREVGYINAGTIEFLVDKQANITLLK